MSRLSSVKEILLKLENLHLTGNGTEERKYFKKKLDDITEQLMKSSDDFEQNKKLIESLGDEERELNQCVQDNRTEIYKLVRSIKKLQKETDLQKAELDAKRKDQDYIIHAFKESAVIKTSLSQKIINCLQLQTKLEPIDSENFRLQFIFEEGKLLKLSYNVKEHIFDIEAIEPPHPAFDSIRELLQNTGDVSGLLHAIRKFHFKIGNDDEK